MAHAIVDDGRAVTGVREQLASVVEAAPDPVLIGLPDGRMQWMNAAGRALLGFEVDEDISRYRIEDLFSEEAMARIYATDMPVLLRDGAWRGEWTLRARDGTPIPVEVTPHIHPIEGGDDDYYVSAIMRDLRPWLAEQHRVEESERRLADAERVAGLGSWEWDLSTNEVTWSRGFWHLHGLDIETVRPSFDNWLATVHPDDVDYAFEKVQGAASRRGPVDFTYRGVHTDGRDLVLRSRGEVICDEAGRGSRMVGTVLDVTAQHEVEQALRASEQRARSIIDTSVVAYVEVDGGGRVTDWNRQAEATYGWSRGEALGSEIADLVVPDEGGLEAQDLFGWSGDLPTSESRRFETTAARRDGRAFPVEVVVWPIEDDGRRVYGSAHIDISERRAVEQAKNEFVSVVSHELRTPLTSIHGALGLLRGGLLGDLSVRGQRMVDIAVDNTDRLVRLINDILDIERLESGALTLKRRRCEAEELVRHAVELIRPMADEAEVGIELDLQPGSIWADPDRIEQTISNLLSNAIKFSLPRTTVDVSTSVEGDEFVVRVRDHGRGIPDDQLDGIFGRFHQVDASDSRGKGGTGLGLAICRTIVEQHGGKIWAESTMGEGATFTVTLPVAAPVRDPIEPDGPTVLVCDDDASVREVVCTLLEAHGYRAVPVAGGAQLVDAALAHRPSAILLDLLMPGMDGWQAAATLRQHEMTREIPLVVLSVLDEKDAVAPGGLSGRLGKPIDADSLVNAVHRAVEGAPSSSAVLLVEDDADLAAVLVERVSRLGVTVHHAPTARHAFEVCDGLVPDVLVLDLVLPDQDGYAVVAHFRRDPRLRGVPLVVYSASDLTDAQRQQLRLGESYYLTKSRVPLEELEQHVLGLLDHLTGSTGTST